MQPGLVPATGAGERKKLQDRAAPLPFGLVELESAPLLGLGYQSLPGTIETAPLAFASI